MAISISANPTVLTEEEGSQVTVTLSSSNPILEGGLVVTVDSDVNNALGQFDVFATEFENAQLVGVNDDTSGFNVRLTEQTGTLTLPIFDDQIADAMADLTFTVQPGEGYTVDESAASVSLTLQDAESTPSAPETEPTPEPSTGELPVVSFEAVPSTLSEEAENNLVEWKWRVTGDFPEDGLVVNLDTLGENNVILFTEQFAASPEPEFVDSEIVNFDEETGRLNILLSEPEASFRLYILNDILEEGTQPFDFQLADGEGYTVDPEQNSTLLTITDDNGGSGVGPTVGISTSRTDLAEGDELTVNFNLDGEIPEDGLQVLVQSPVFGALGQFDLADLSNLELSGIEGAPEVGDAGGSSFFVTITESAASITTSVFNDIVAEEALELPFRVVNGEEYEVDPDADSITLNVVDETQLVGPTVDFTVDQTNVVEGDSITLTFAVDGEIPAEGVTVLVNDTNSAQNQLRSLTEFDVANLEFSGISEFPTPAEGDSGFFVTITEPTATITIPILDEGVDEDEASESFNFELIEGEAYEAASEASAVNLNISDVDDGGTPPETPTFSPVFGTINGDTIEVEGGERLIFAGDRDDLIDASISSEGDNRIYAGSGDDTLVLGTGDRFVGGEGSDRFFATSGGDNTLTGGAGADQFWIASAEIPEAANTITDFTSGEDIFGITGLAIGFEELSITQIEGDALIAANDSDLAIIQGIEAASLSADNFAFG